MLSITEHHLDKKQYHNIVWWMQISTAKAILRLLTLTFIKDHRKTKQNNGSRTSQARPQSSDRVVMCDMRLKLKVLLSRPVFPNLGPVEPLHVDSWKTHQLDQVSQSRKDNKIRKTDMNNTLRHILYNQGWEPCSRPIISKHWLSSLDRVHSFGPKSGYTLHKHNQEQSFCNYC